MSGIELWVVIGAAACVGIYLHGNEDDVVVRRRGETRGWAWTTRFTKKRHK